MARSRPSRRGTPSRGGAAGLAETFAEKQRQSAPHSDTVSNGIDRREGGERNGLERRPLSTGRDDSGPQGAHRDHNREESRTSQHDNCKCGAAWEKPDYHRVEPRLGSSVAVEEGRSAVERVLEKGTEIR